jgi:uncharacterized membrane protein YgcG
MKAIYCNQVEALLCDYLDGLLSVTEETALEAHVGGCQSCSTLVADMRLAMRYAQEAGAVDVPVDLISRILDQTTGQAPAGVPEWRHRLTGWWDKAVSPVVRSVLEPRFALGMAMTVISCSMLLSLAGFDVRSLAWSDLQPAKLKHNVTRNVALAGAWATKRYENLRVVYEIQTQLQALRDENADADNAQAKDPAATKTGSKSGNDSGGKDTPGGATGGSGSRGGTTGGSKVKDNRSTDSRPGAPGQQLKRGWTTAAKMVACAMS